MQEPLKYLHVNWIDGMKINKSHFLDLQHAVNDQVKDAIACNLNSHNYGLLPPFYGKTGPVKIILNADHQNLLQVKVFECRAVTPAGARLEIVENSQEAQGFVAPLPETSSEIDMARDAVYYVALSIHPFTRIPVGNANPQEDPPRYPYTLPEVKLHLIAEEQLTKKELGPYFLLIGKINIAQGKPDIDREYIPPCTTVNSHPQLITIHAGFDRFFGQFELDVIKIQKKILDKDQTNMLASVLFQLSGQILSFLNAHILPFRWSVPDLPPLVMFETVGSCARVIRNAIEANSGKAKEELLNYFTEWCSVNQSEFEKILSEAVNFHYDHTRIMETAQPILRFVEEISALFSKLSTLEYIGKKKETSIFVKEQTVKKSFLAD